MHLLSCVVYVQYSKSPRPSYLPWALHDLLVTSSEASPATSTVVRLCHTIPLKPDAAFLYAIFGLILNAQQ